jgi:hypothetical protein
MYSVHSGTDEHYAIAASSKARRSQQSDAARPRCNFQNRASRSCHTHNQTRHGRNQAQGRQQCLERIVCSTSGPVNPSFWLALFPTAELAFLVEPELPALARLVQAQTKDPSPHQLHIRYDSLPFIY